MSMRHATPSAARSAGGAFGTRSVGPFDALLQLDIEHGYFADGVCRGLSLQATAASADLLQRAGALLRASERGLTIYHDRGRRAALRALVGQDGAPFVLVFVARSSDPWLATCTQGMARQPDTLLCFDTRRAAPPEADGRRRLHCAEHASAADRAALAGPLLSRALTQAQQLMPPAFVLRLALRRGSVDGWVGEGDAPPAPRYLVRLQSTATRWKYYLPAEWAPQQPQVVDLAGQTAFEPARTEQLGDGRPVLTICSQGDIALQQRPAQRFQLRVRGPQADRVLIKRLPVACAGQISALNVAGVRTLVSEIYVNR